MIARLPLEKGIRNWLLAFYVRDHFEKAGDMLHGELMYNHQIDGEVLDIVGATLLGTFFVKISNEELSDEEINAFFEFCRRNNVHEGILISKNRSEDRRMCMDFYFESRPIIRWFRVRNIQEVLDYVRGNYKFEVLLEGLDAYVVCAPRSKVK